MNKPRKRVFRVEFDPDDVTDFTDDDLRIKLTYAVVGVRPAVIKQPPRRTRYEPASRRSLNDQSNPATRNNDPGRRR